MKRLLGLGLPLFVMPYAANAALITPAQVFASTYYGSGQSPISLINNSGLNIASSNVLTFTHAADANASNMWHAGQGQGTGGSAPAVASQYLVFNLGGNYDLSSAYLWQMLQPNLLGRGVKGFELYASSGAPTAASAANPPATYDLTGFTQILGPSTLAQGSGSTTATQTFALSGATNVRQVYLKINSDWNGLANDYVGLSEIKFEGTLIASAAFNWNNAAGGAWQTGANWSAAAAPTVNDVANFAINNTYTVTSASNVAVAGLNVSAGDVSLNLGSTSLQSTAINLSGGRLTVPGYTSGTAAAGEIGGALTFADGTLRIDGGAYKPSIGIVYSNTPGGTGRIDSWAISGAAGTAARPTLELINGAVASNPSPANFGSLFFGINGGKAAVHISGANSRLLQNQTVLNDSNLMVLGMGGAIIGGNYVPSDAIVTATNGALISGNNSVPIAVDGATANVTVDNSTIRSVSGNLIVGWRRYNNDVGRESVGVLNVINGGKATGQAAVYIGSRGGTGTANIDGVGSSISTPNGLIVGFERFNFTGRSSEGTLNLTNGATASTNFAVFIGLYGGNGVINVQSGATLTAPFGTIFAGDNIGASNVPGQGTLNVTAGGIANAYTLHVGTRGGVTGFTTISGVNSIVNTTSYAVVGNDGTGTLVIENGGRLNSGGDVYIGANGGSFTTVGSVRVGKSDGSDASIATLATAGNLNLGEGGTSGATLTVYPKGNVEIANALRATPSSPPPVNTLKVHLAGGSIKTATTAFTDAAYFNWTGGTLWYTSGTGSSSTIGADGSATLTVPVTGVLKGSTHLNAQLVVDGTVSPGDGNAAAIFSANNLTLGTSGGAQGEFAADVDFTTNTADLLSIAGSVDLANAKLSLSLVEAPVGQLPTPLTFLLIANDGSDPVVGTFAEIDLGTLSTLQYSVDYAFNGAALNGIGTGNDVAITFVPEPSTLLMALLATAGVLVRRRCSTK